ncbi:hypothetical protein SAMN05216389_101149 [Oceanobacillus limi]|uniref:DUF4871 domain-containing protein n=1 Tax=Oceanobacillus limi TaxID=930131 RepID=A0A1H9Y2Q0_9BACI|nr:hypothetical protein [Oceanobacillus limi]SES63004.1 hypothetical protein SAMN05216389_101149 [Oceanobacillus limi]
MKRVLLLSFISTLFVVVGCTSHETELNLPEDIPEFVQKSHFEEIDWENTAEKFGDRNIIGNENKSGVIGTEMPSVRQIQKWMWHLWGIEEPGTIDLTVVGYHRETETVHKILTSGWTNSLYGPNNGADAHMPSSVELTETGEWAIFLYTNDTLFDTLIFDIDE